MKKLVTIEETNQTPLESLMGKKVTFFCLNYIYTGKLIGINGTAVLLEDPAIVFETGKFTDSSYKDVQPMNVKEFFIGLSCIESFGVLK